MSLLRRALEDDLKGNDGQPETVVMAGPLSEVYTQALAVAYAKQDPATGVVAPAMETQAIDAMLQAAAMKKLKFGPSDNQANPSTTIYGISKLNVDRQQTIDVVGKLYGQVEKDPSHGSDFILVIDASETAPVSTANPESNTEQFTNLNQEAEESRNAMIATMESVASLCGIRTATSLEHAISLLTQ